MTIAKFKKVTLMGLMKTRPEIMSRLQTLGSMHIVSLNPQSDQNPFASALTLMDKMKSALKYLDGAPEKAQPKKIVHEFSSEKILADVARNQLQFRKAMDRHDFLQVRINDLSVWGNFHMSDLDDMGGIRLWFYKIRNRDVASLPGDVVMREIYRNNVFIYLVVLAKTEPHASIMPSARIHTGSEPLDDLMRELNEIIETIDDLNEERRQLTRYRDLLARELARFTDLTNLQMASEKTGNQSEFFLVQGWVPDSVIDEVSRFCRENHLAMTIEPASPDDTPPTLMETYSWTSGGIEIVNFYQTPGYRSIDPSFMTFFSFSLFFAIILADAGYGIVIAAITMLLWKRLSRSAAGVWLKPLLITISVFSIAYGVILGSYFGVELSHDSFLGKFKLLDINNFNAMMKLVLVIGCLHIMAANIMKAWHADELNARLHSGSFVFLIAGFMLLAQGLIAHSTGTTQFSLVVIIISLLALMISSSSLPVNSISSLMKRLLLGMGALAHLTTLFGDVLSYLRLFALGLAGASLAVTFNHIAVQVSANTLNGHGWVLGFLVLIIGQTLNFILCVMSGVIHGLRLNYIEFFKWSVVEEGYIYAPLKRKEMSHE